ncbi:hypothetical protein Tco_0527451 [Tanacetum coccineum]
MALPYGILLSRLYEHVCTTYPLCSIGYSSSVDHVMIPLIEGKARRTMVDGKRPHPQTPSELSCEPSPAPHQDEENDSVDNYTLDPIVYINQLPPIQGGESLEFKQTKGILKCFGHFLSNLRKKK